MKVKRLMRLFHSSMLHVQTNKRASIIQATERYMHRAWKELIRDSRSEGEVPTKRWNVNLLCFLNDSLISNVDHLVVQGDLGKVRSLEEGGRLLKTN